MFKKKELSAAQIEAVETKDFFDRIVPGMIKSRTFQNHSFTVALKFSG